MRNLNLIVLCSFIPAITLCSMSSDGMKAASLDQQELSRTLAEYHNAFQNTKFSKIIMQRQGDPDFRWLDGGSGAGLMAIDSLFMKFNPSNFKKEMDVEGFYLGELSFSKPPFDHQVITFSLKDYTDRFFSMKRKQIEKMTIDQMERVIVGIKEEYKGLKGLDNISAEFYLEQQRTFFYRLAKMGHLKGIAGQNGNLISYISRVQDIPNETLGEFDLITDFFGAYTYSKDRISVLKKYFNLLKAGGSLLIATGNNALVLNRIPNPLQRRIPQPIRKLTKSLNYRSLLEEIISSELFLKLKKVTKVANIFSYEKTGDMKKTLDYIENLEKKLCFIEKQERHSPPDDYIYKWID